jgi:hypothetical protein
MLIAMQNILGSIPMMDIKIQNRHAQTVFFDSAEYRNGH